MGFVVREMVYTSLVILLGVCAIAHANYPTVEFEQFADCDTPCSQTATNYMFLDAASGQNCQKISASQSMQLSCSGGTVTAGISSSGDCSDMTTHSAASGTCHGGGKYICTTSPDQYVVELRSSSQDIRIASGVCQGITSTTSQKITCSSTTSATVDQYTSSGNCAGAATHQTSSLPITSDGQTISCVAQTSAAASIAGTSAALML